MEYKELAQLIKPFQIKNLQDLSFAGFFVGFSLDVLYTVSLKPIIDSCQLKIYLTYFVAVKRILRRVGFASFSASNAAIPLIS